jgi:hypothetical protein
MHRWAWLALVVSAASFADEGMWTYNNFPTDKVKAKYGFEPTKDWLDQLRLASVRVAGGCSASIVSATGLVMTNHHCVRECVEDLAGLKKVDLTKNGFFARTEKDEARCDKFELNQLSEITDVTARLQAVTKDVAPEKFADTQKQEIAKIEKECQSSDEFRCEVITLFRGGRYDLYKYRRFQDIRLVFAPEEAIAFFGGDPDNFMFPRFDLDVGFLRIYGEDGKPLATPEHLGWSSEPLKDGDLTFVSGNPGGTSRLLTVAQLEDDRDFRLVYSLGRFSEWRGMLTEYQNRGVEQKRHSTQALFSIENSLKVYKGRHAALADKAFFEQQVAAEKALRAKIDGNPEWKKTYGATWDTLAGIVKKQQAYRKEYMALERGPSSDLFTFARQLVRAADELPRPNPERLKEYSDARLPQLKQSLASKAPIYDEFETARLAFSLVKLREDLGPDHPAVKKILGLKSPQALAKELVAGTHLKDPKVREELFAGGKAKLDASKDPLIAFARLYDEDARAIRKKFEDEVDGPMKRQGELLARARFAVYGTNTYPDATFTLRLSYGAVKGYLEDGHEVKPLTTFAGAFARHTGAEPFALPRSWLDAKSKLNLDTPFDVATTNDIIGGNSGSPLVNSRREVIGLVFDGNIQSLGGDYGFDESVNRAIAVTANALVEALDKIYGAHRLVEELKPTK